MTDLLGAVTPIPCLSLWEPWASLIVAGVKRHETRHWATRLRGRVATHAAKRVEVDVDPELDRLCRFALGEGWRSTQTVGCVVAVADLTACHRTEDLGRETPAQAYSDWIAGNFEPGRFAFALDQVRPLIDPLPIKGRQGFFHWRPPADLEARLGPVVDHWAAARRFGAAG